MGSSHSKENKVVKTKTHEQKSHAQQTQVEKDLDRLTKQQKPEPVVQNQIPKTPQTVLTSEPTKPVRVSNIPAEEKKEHVVQTNPVIAKTEVSKPVEHTAVEEPKTVEIKEQTEVGLNKNEVHEKPEEVNLSDPKSHFIQPIIHKIGPDSIPSEEVQLSSSHHISQALETKMDKSEEPVSTIPTVFNAEAIKQSVHHIQPETVQEKVDDVEIKPKEEEVKAAEDQKLVDEKIEKEEVKAVVKEEEQVQPVKAEEAPVHADTEAHRVITDPVIINSKIELKETVCGIKEDTFGHDNSTPEVKEVMNKTLPVVATNVSEPIDLKEHVPVVDQNVSEPIDLKTVHTDAETHKPTALKEVAEEIGTEVVHEIPKATEPIELKKGKGKKGKKGKHETTNEDKHETH